MSKEKEDIISLGWREEQADMLISARKEIRDLRAKLLSVGLDLYTHVDLVGGTIEGLVPIYRSIVIAQNDCPTGAYLRFNGPPGLDEKPTVIYNILDSAPGIS